MFKRTYTCHCSSLRIILDHLPSFAKLSAIIDSVTRLYWTLALFWNASNQFIKKKRITLVLIFDIEMIKITKHFKLVSISHIITYNCVKNTFLVVFIATQNVGRVTLYSTKSISSAADHLKAGVRKRDAAYRVLLSNHMLEYLRIIII